MIHTWTTPEPRAYATPEEAARGLERLLDDLADTRGTCVAALANLRGGLAAHDPARLVLAAEALSAVSLELAYWSGDAARMGAALTLCGEEAAAQALQELPLPFQCRRVWWLLSGNKLVLEV